MKTPLRVGVLGATGLVGRNMIASLERSDCRLESVHFWATEKGAGEVIPFRGGASVVERWSDGVEAGLDVLLLATKPEVSRAVAPAAVARGVLVIDNSRAYRMAPDVPLVVPEVNPEAIKSHSGIIANPNCSTIQLVVALKPLQRAAGLERVIVSTYQAVSGIGREGIRTLAAEESEDPGRVSAGGAFPYPIHRNVIPQCDAFVEDGWTREEWKMQVETRKILEEDALPIGVTCVRVPVVAGHSEAVTVDLKSPLNPEEARRIFAAAPGIFLQDDPPHSIYPTARDVAGRDGVFIGRVRREAGRPGTLHFWVVADNLLKGAATNAVQIMEAAAQ
ncbi:MAG: aspartate-semialdehyde dehydrogenase [Candidatus Eisenbacteria bacterium]|nr:aspartate-semialdehyde dehydrogenase [Candidatus Eisenbacteria bacterium]MBU1947587.1 aspartate-semialdehyde dehydrogenase [Candidatus Eisenbacteria bacterium]